MSDSCFLCQPTEGIQQAHSRSYPSNNNYTSEKKKIKKKIVFFHEQAKNLTKYPPNFLIFNTPVSSIKY